MAGAHQHGVYLPRQTQSCDALQIVREQLPSFASRVEDEGHASLPAFVRDELEGFGACGDFRRGFVRLQCSSCAAQLRVPFSCKSRGVCPSCMGRRMSETAALLVDHRLPKVPYRQWVLTFPGPLAVRLGYDTKLLGAVCARFSKRVSQLLRRRVQRQYSLRRRRELNTGALVVVQRFRNDLGLFTHLHCLVLDGCFDGAGQGDAPPRFLPLQGLSNEDLLGVLGQVYGDLEEEFGDYGEPGDEGHGWMVACVQLGERERQLALVGTRDAEASGAAPREKPLTVAGFGMQLNAATTVDGADRKALERICRYLMRPAFAQDAVEALDNGKVRVHFKTPTRTGQLYTDMSRDTFLARLAALVPPPRFNLVRYYGVLASQHKLREKVAPRPRPGLEEFEDTGERQLKLFEVGRSLDAQGVQEFSFVQRKGCEQEAKRPRRIAWAKLLARVFEVDVTTCVQCGGRLAVVEVVKSPERIALLLDKARGPPRPRPAVVGQLRLF